jgi:hypothetical protein
MRYSAPAYELFSSDKYHSMTGSTVVVPRFSIAKLLMVNDWPRTTVLGKVDHTTGTGELIPSPFVRNR